MSRLTQPAKFYVGWDVGGWNCDRNRNSRDAIAILDAERRLCGSSWRGNLRELINEASTTADWIRGLFALCDVDIPSMPLHVTMAIDIPLGFSTAFIALVENRRPVSDALEASSSNPYLFRQTERFLFQRGLRPLSPLKDMIGSQATKGMHVLAKFAPHVASCGIWTDQVTLTAIESYPTAAKRSMTVNALRAGYASLDHDDQEDALFCALVAYLFAEQREALRSPGADVSPVEGWIWVPCDALLDVA